MTGLGTILYKTNKKKNAMAIDTGELTFVGIYEWVGSVARVD